jgi:2-hydroxy-3-oxopropionate reductase
MTRPRIAFLGTGLMGAPMASNLLKDGLALTVWNRTRAKAEALRPLGAAVADSAAEAVDGAEFVFCILENGSVVEEVLFAGGVASRLRPGTVLVDMSSIHPRQAIDHARRLAALRIAHLDAPVSGGPNGAVDKSLAIMVGGEPADFDRAAPFLARLGRPTRVGKSGSGQIAKLCSQMISAAAMCAVSEVMMLARSHDIDAERIPEALAGGFADSKVLQIHGRRMISRDFVPGGHVRTFAKDLDAAADLVGANGLDLPLARLTREMFGRLCADGHGEEDIAVMMLEIERRNPSLAFA